MLRRRGCSRNASFGSARFLLWIRAVDHRDSERQIVILGNDSDERTVVAPLHVALAASGVATETRADGEDAWLRHAIERRAIFLVVSDVGDFETWVESARAESPRSRLADDVLTVLDSAAYEPLELEGDWRMLVPR